ncbi:MAG TPA: hypothetical protein PLB45_02940 [Bacilli bacterium]|jgi:hypothetical protein|nr:hypothetical protein [Bacilli bacterium]HPZ23561.1 hypothetical protein [Bacilli bacterium]HQC83810.1 hypothetical protein [Bacilli bacterium]
MTKYLMTIDQRKKDYFKLLSPDIPRFLEDYIETPEMLKQQYISITCGTIYTNLFKSHYIFNSLDHAIAVALIIWHFTKDEKETLSGLFHDIATPAFKHCIDFLNGDYVTQESTEDLTTTIISNSKEIMGLLKRDNITLEEVDNYHIYPIADNDTPRLSSDRLEYSLSNGLFTYELKDFNSIKEMYQDIVIGKNEDGIIELEFKTESIATSFVLMTTDLSLYYRLDKTRYSMQLLADIIKKLIEENKLKITDLYNLGDKDIIDIILQSKYKDIYNIWLNATEIKTSETKPECVYYVHHPAKVRYINPMCNSKRIRDINTSANESINYNLNYKMDNFVYLDGIKDGIL